MSNFVGIVIVNYNTYDELLDCIKSIRNNTTSNYRIYIVDNGSKTTIQDKIKSSYADSKDVEIIILNKNLGYSGGNNVGIKKAVADGAEYILITNSDIEFKNDVIRILVNDIEGNIVVAGPNIVNLTGKDGQQLIKTYDLTSAFLDRMPFYILKKYLHLFLLNSKKINHKIHYFGMVQGSCFLIKSEDFKEIGYFDDNVFLYSEERIISIKMKKLGYQVCYDPDAKILHKEGQTTKRNGNAFADYHRYVSDYYTVMKYCDGKPWKKKIFKYLRLFNFEIKARYDSNYYLYLIEMNKKFHEIDNGNYLVTAMNRENKI